MKILTIVGARPQFIKAAVISRALKNAQIQECIIHTGQHFDANMSAVFFDEMDIPKPHYNLAVSGLSQGAMTGKMLAGIEELLIVEKPTAVLVYGDTNSTLAGALAAQKLHIPVVHVEAGLRSFNMQMPEEVNRVLTDRISSLLFIPTQMAAKNLAEEGYNNLNIPIELVGDVMYDASLFYANKAIETVYKNPFYLATLHRAENTDNFERLKSIVEGLNTIHKSIKVVLPLHPRTAKVLKDAKLSLKVETIAPQGYLEMIGLLKNCKGVITDSGGLQKEAYFFKKPCITMRDETEWVELVEKGYNTLVGANCKKLIDTALSCETRTINFEENIYGEGNAGELIVQSLIKHFS